MLILEGDPAATWADFGSVIEDDGESDPFSTSCNKGDLSDILAKRENSESNKF